MSRLECGDQEATAINRVERQENIEEDPNVRTVFSAIVAENRWLMVVPLFPAGVH